MEVSQGNTSDQVNQPQHNNQQTYLMVRVILLGIVIVGLTVYLVFFSSFKQNKFQKESQESNKVLSTQCENFSDASTFREFIFCNFGFSQEAQTRIRLTTSIMIPSDSCSCWVPLLRQVKLLDYSREAAVHELSHAFWEDERGDEQKRLRLVKGLLKLASDEVIKAQYPAASEFARGYVDGIGDWKGMFCNYGNKDCIEQNHYELTDEEIIEFTKSYRILDHEIYAGFASWTMGKLSTGSHKLPDFMVENFEKQFTEDVKVVPYYDGGPK